MYAPFWCKPLLRLIVYYWTITGGYQKLIYLLGPRKSLTTPTIGHCWMADVCLSAGWVLKPVQVGSKPIVFKGKPLSNDITSLDPARALISNNPGCYVSWINEWASYAVWEDNLHISPPHVPNPPFIGATAVVVRDNNIIFPKLFFYDTLLSA